MSLVTSPRLSFSNDFSQEDEVPIDRRDTTLLLESVSDFEFSICSSIGHEPSSADDLFADGMILPVKFPDKSFSSPTSSQMARYDKLSRKVSSLPPTNSPDTSKKEIVVPNSESEEKSQTNKSFWGFKRSTSLNCDIKKSLCSLPLLLRSNSTGSAPNPKQKATSCKETNKSSAKKLPPVASSSSSSTYVYALPHKPPLKKNYSGSHGNVNGFKFSPVLNVPTPYITKGAANLLGSILRNGKEKSRK